MSAASSPGMTQRYERGFVTVEPLHVDEPPATLFNVELEGRGFAGSLVVDADKNADGLLEVLRTLRYLLGDFSEPLVVDDPKGVMNPAGEALLYLLGEHDDDEDDEVEA